MKVLKSRVLLIFLRSVDRNAIYIIYIKYIILPSNNPTEKLWFTQLEELCFLKRSLRWLLVKLFYIFSCHDDCRMLYNFYDETIMAYFRQKEQWIWDILSKSLSHISLRRHWITTSRFQLMILEKWCSSPSWPQNHRPEQPTSTFVTMLLMMLQKKVDIRIS